MGNSDPRVALQPQLQAAIKPKEPQLSKQATMPQPQAIPKINPSKQPQVHKVPTKQSKHQPKAKVTQRWVPKALLHAQGYYEGKASVWLPK